MDGMGELIVFGIFNAILQLAVALAQQPLVWVIVGFVVVVAVLTRVSKRRRRRS